MNNLSDCQWPVAPFGELRSLLQIPDSDRGLLPVLSIVQGLITQHPVLESLLNITETGVGDAISTLQQATNDKNSALKLTKEKGLCSERPVYALLVEAVLSLPSLPSNAWSMLAVVMEFILTHRQQFNEHPNRLVEFSKAIRQLMLMKEPIALLGRETYASYRQLASAMERLSVNPQLQSTDQRYARYVETTLSNDWKQVIRSVGRPRKTSGGSRRKRPSAERTVTTDETDVSILGLPVLLTPDDILSAPEAVAPTVLLEVQPDAKWSINRLSLDVIEDPGITRVHAIGITQRLVQANNKSLLSTSILQPDEILFLLNALFTRKSESTGDINCQLAILLMLWTGFDLEQLLNWQFCGDGTGLVQHAEHWYTQCIVEPVLIKDARQKIVLSCPLAVSKLALALSTERKNKQLFTFSKEVEPKQLVKDWLARLSKRHGMSIALDRVEQFLANRLQCSPALDPVFQRFAFGVERFQYRVQRYYTQMTGEQIARGISSIWWQVGQELTEPNCLDSSFYHVHALDPDAVYGSQRAGNLSQQRNLVDDLLKSCRKFSRPQVERDLTALVDYHNQYAEYTAFMLLAGTGCRAVRNPFPSLALIFDAIMFVCDKDDSTIATRLVSLCPIVHQQIGFYRSHINALANRIAAIAPEIAEHNQQIMTIESSDLGFLNRLIKMKTAKGPLFYLSDEGGQWVTHQLRPAKLVDRTQPFGLEVNFGRHHVRSQLLKQGVHNELINQFLGHWSIGESPFSQFSHINPYDSDRILRPVLSAVMEEQGWKPLRSLIT